MRRALSAVLLLSCLVPATVGARVLSRDELARLPLLPVDPAAPLPAGQPPGRALRKGLPAHPRLSPQLDRLVFELAAASDEPSREAAARRLAVPWRAGRVQVVVRFDPDGPIPAPGSVVRVGGVPLEVVGRRDRRVEAWVAGSDLVRLAGAPGVQGVEAAIRPQTFEVISKGVANTKADKLQALGVDGSGVVVGVLDAGFAGYEQLLGTELPAQVITRSFGIDITGGGEAHGTAVAEIVHDMAPGALLVLVAYGSTYDFEDAVEWLVDNGASIITTSTGSSLTGPCDGRDAMAAAANAAVDQGTIFLASAGNYGDGHYLATFTPSAKPGFEGFHAFTPVRTVAFFGLGNNCYGLGAGTELDVSLVWDDWGPDPLSMTARADYDLYLMRYDPDAGWQFTDVASDYNQAQGWYPWEMLHVAVPQNGCYGLAIRQTQASRDHELHLYAYNMTFANQFQVPERSVIDPCVGEKVQCIGATSIYDTLAQYSSQGPANPNELTGQVLMKPDFTAPAGTETVALGGFPGTSASAPHAAGALALLLQVTGGDSQAALALARGLARDLGEPGQDPRFGWGRIEVGTCTDAWCDDHLPCTQSSCQPWVGCQQVPVGDGCVLDHACHAAGAANPVDACQVCDPATPGAWADAPDGTPCDDGRPCTLGDTCLEGACVPGAPAPAGERAEGCVIYTCDGVSTDAAATFVPAATPCGAPAGCADGRVTPAAACDGQGACVGAAGVSCAPYAACVDGTSCATTCATDADCTPLDRCVAAACVADQAPVADAGAPQSVAAASPVSLDAGASTDPEADPLAFAWSQISGPTVVLDDATAVSPGFVAPAPGAATTLRFVVRAWDGRLWSAPALTSVVVAPVPNQAPVANAGADLVVDEGATVTLDGSASNDPDLTPFTFAWRQDAGPAVTLDDPAAKQPTFVSPQVEADTQLTFSLVVSDGVAQSEPSEVHVLVRDLPGPEPAPDAVEDLAVDAVDGTTTADGRPEAAAEAGPEPTTEPEAEPAIRTGGGCTTAGSVPAPASSASVLVSALGTLLVALRRRLAS